MSRHYINVSGSISKKGQSGLFSQRIKEVADEYNIRLLRKLAADGQRLCSIAYQTKNTKNRTGAQTDSYFWVVTQNGYVRAVGNADGGRGLYGGKDLNISQTGNSMGNGSPHKGLKGTWWKDVTGVEWWVGFDDALGNLIRQAAPRATYSVAKFDLYVLNAAYYTSWLEDGSYAVGLAKIFGHPISVKHWRVISQIKSECEAVARKYGRKSKVHKIGVHGEDFKPASASHFGSADIPIKHRPK